MDIEKTSPIIHLKMIRPQDTSQSAIRHMILRNYSINFVPIAEKSLWHLQNLKSV